MHYPRRVRHAITRYRSRAIPINAILLGTKQNPSMLRPELLPSEIRDSKLVGNDDSSPAANGSQATKLGK